MSLVVRILKFILLASDERSVLRYMELSTCLVEIAGHHLHDEIQARPYAFILRKGQPELKAALDMT